MAKTFEDSEIAAAGGVEDITQEWLGELLMPQDRILAEKGNGYDLEIYERALSDDQVQACLQQRFDAVVSAEWKVHPGGPRRVDRLAAESIEAQLKAIAWDDIYRKMLYGVYYGYSVAECLFARVGGEVILDDSRQGIKVKHRRRFRFARDGSLRLITRSRYLDGEPVPECKFWTFNRGGDNSDDPYGLGLGHWLYWPVFFKRNDIKFWLMFLEKFAGPTVVGRYPAGTSKEKQRELLKAGSAIRTRASVIVPEGMILELLEAARSGSADYKDLEAVMNSAISKVCLSQTMTTDDGASLSQAKVHQSVARSVIKADADLVDQSFNRGPVRWLTDWNYPGAAYPQVWRITEPSADLNDQVERDTKLFAMGFPRSVEYIRDTYGDGFVFPAEGGDTPTGLNGAQIQSIVQIAQSVGTGQLTVASARSLVQLAVPAVSDRQAAEIIPDDLAPAGAILPPPAGDPEFTEPEISDTAERYAAALRAEAGPIIDGWIDTLRDALGEAGDLAEFSEKLLTLYPSLPGENLRAIMANAMTAASLAGAAEDTGEIANG